MTKNKLQPALLILNQMAGPMTWELAEDGGEMLGCVAMLTGHPDTLQKSHEKVLLYPAAAYQRGSFARRALSWLHYAIQAFFWLWRWPADIPVLLFSNPPILCWVGWLMKRLRGQRYSVMVHDIYPDILVRLAGYSERHPLIRLWRWLNRKAYENADAVMTLGEMMAANLEQQFDSSKTRAGKIEVVYPWVDTERIKPIPKDDNWFAQKYGQVNKLTVMYSGNMGLGHDIETMLEAAKALQGHPEVHFMFIGAGPKWQLVKNTIDSSEPPNITLLSWQPEESLPYQLAAADVGLVALEEAFQGAAIPSKTLYMMAAGAAILGISSKPSDLQQIVEETGSGKLIETGDVNGMIDVLQHWSQCHTSLVEIRRYARSTACNNFERHTNTRIILSKMHGSIRKNSISSRSLEQNGYGTKRMDI